MVGSTRVFVFFPLKNRKLRGVDRGRVTEIEMWKSDNEGDFRLHAKVKCGVVEKI